MSDFKVKRNQGASLVEVLIAFGVLSVLSIGSISFLYQTVSSRDKVVATAEATDAAQGVIERIGNSIKAATSMDITNQGKRIEIQGSSCEVYSLTGGVIYYDESASDGVCPTASTNTPLTSSRILVDNENVPTLTLFSGSPDDSDAASVLIQIRVKAIKQMATGEIQLQQTVSKRR